MLQYTPIHGCRNKPLGLFIFGKATEASQCNQAEWERVISNIHPYIKPTCRCCPQLRSLWSIPPLLS